MEAGQRPALAPLPGSLSTRSLRLGHPAGKPAAVCLPGRVRRARLRVPVS